VAQGLVVRSAIRAAAAEVRTPGRGAARAAEVAWAVLPAVGLVAVLFLTWRALERTAAPASPAPVVSVRPEPPARESWERPQRPL